MQWANAEAQNWLTSMPRLREHTAARQSTYAQGHVMRVGPQKKE